MPGRWFEFGKRQDHGFEDEKILTCFISKVYFYLESRNAWGGLPNWPNYGDHAFSLSIKESVQSIESKRVRGSHWRIQELPALVIGGKDDALLVLDPFSSKPFSQFQLSSLKGLASLEAFGEALNCHQSVGRIFVSDIQNISPASFPFFDHHSVSFGGHRKLEWDVAKSSVTISHALKAQNKVCNLLQKC